MLTCILHLALFLFFLIAPQGAMADSGGLARKLREVVSTRFNDSSAISVLRATDGKPIFERQASMPLKPASVVKVVTTFAALTQLGPDYQFQTAIYGDLQSGNVNKLYIKGSGDPSFTIESAFILARKLKLIGVRKIEQVITDGTLFAYETERYGARAYEAGASALSFNYNSLTFKICPRLPGENALISVDPWELGVGIKGSIKTVKGLGSFTINETKGGYTAKGTIGRKAECVSVYRSISNPGQYFGKVFTALIKAAGITVKQEPAPGVVPADMPILTTFDSKPLRNIVQDLNHFSNNFIADQLLYRIGATGNHVTMAEQSAPLSRERGIHRLNQIVNALGVKDRETRFMDASGLSHANRLSARAVTTVLLEVQRNFLIRAAFQNSLSVGGKSGTLKKRKFDNGVSILGKTGTLDGVSSLAGFVTDLSGVEYVFAIIQNEVASVERAHSNEEFIVNSIGTWK